MHIQRLIVYAVCCSGLGVMLCSSDPPEKPAPPPVAALPELVVIPAGTLQVKRKELYATAIHPVFVDSFRIGRYEVTNAQYARFLNEFGSDQDKLGNKLLCEDKWGLYKDTHKWKPAEGYADHPAVSVTWYGARAYCRQYGFRLPTEAEWEYACRAGTATRYHFSDTGLGMENYAWFSSTSGGRTHPVGKKKPNQFGLFDMYGNVSEWCHDWYDKKFYYEGPANNPRGPVDGTSKVLRGGSWYSFAVNLEPGNRSWGFPDACSNHYGFRCARDLPDTAGTAEQ